MIGDVIKRYRKLRGFTQPQLCKILNIHQTHISKIEQNKRCPSVELLAQIQKTLKIPMEEIWCEEEADKLHLSRLRPEVSLSKGEEPYSSERLLDESIAELMRLLDNEQKEKVLAYARERLEIKIAQEIVEKYGG